MVSVKEAIELSKQDLANRLGISDDRIALVSAGSVTWPDSSLGCPQPGMAYTQVLTPGYLIILSANDKDYEYHAGRGALVIYCQNPTPPIPGMPGEL